MGPLSPLISQTIGNFEILYHMTQKVMKDYELSNDKKTSTLFIFDILQSTVFTHVPRQYFGQIFPYIFSYTEVFRFTIAQHLFSTIVVLNLKRSDLESGYGERKKKNTKKTPKLKALILALGLLQVVGTVKINLKLQTVPPTICLNLKSECLITPNNRWKQLSSINLSYFDVSSSPNYVTLSLYSSIGRGLPIGHSIHFNYHQKYHISEETTHAPQSRHNGSNDIFCNRMQIRPVLVLYIQILDSQYKTNPT